MAGVPEKILEYLMETRIEGNMDEVDTLLEDFLLTHVIFMPIPKLCKSLLNQYPLPSIIHESNKEIIKD